MVAPKAPGHTVRSTYAGGGGVPMLIAVHARSIEEGARPRAFLCGGDRRRQGRRDRDQLQEETETICSGEQTVLRAVAPSSVVKPASTPGRGGLRAGDGPTSSACTS